MPAKKPTAEEKKAAKKQAELKKAVETIDVFNKPPRPLSATMVLEEIPEGSPLLTRPMGAKTQDAIELERLGGKTKVKVHQPLDIALEICKSTYFINTADFDRCYKDLKKANASTEDDITKIMKKYKLGIPSLAVKAACVNMCSLIDSLQKTSMRQLLFFVGPPAHPEFCILNYDKVILRRDPVRVQNKLDLRYRPEFFGWSVEINVQFLENLIKPEQIVNVVNTAGFCSGILEWRPSGKTQAGIHGRFRVKAKTNAA